MERTRSRRARAGVVLLAALALALAARPARADSGSLGGAEAVGGACAPALAAWAARCAAAQGVEVTATGCPHRRAILAVRAPGGRPLEIEVSEGVPGSFARVGALGVSPKGEFPDWKKAPDDARRAFDALAACVERDPSLPMGSGAYFTRISERPSIAWRLVAAALAAVAACALPLRGGRPARATARAAQPQGPPVRAAAAALASRSASAASKLAPLLLLTAATWIFRRALLEEAFFHQNGQGPHWVGFALGDRSSYGPGFFEVLGIAAQRSPASPEGVLFRAQSALAALVPAAAWVIARCAGARPLLAWAIAILFAIDPVLGRIARSESYYAIASSLLFFAAAALASAARGLRVRSARFALGVVASGLFIAQAARIHPVCWAPASLVPLVIVACRGRLARRFATAAAAAAGIGVVVLLASGPTLLDTLRGATGERWLPQAQSTLGGKLGSCAAVGLLPWIAVAALVARRWPAAIVAQRGALLTTVLAIGSATNLLGRLPAWITVAYWALYAPVLAAALAGGLAALARGRRGSATLAAALAASGVALAALRWGAHTALPTDALEQERVLALRDGLPRGAVVAYLARAGKGVLYLPIYPWRNEGRARLLAITPGEERNVRLEVNGPDVFYYRSSLCSTAAGRPACDWIERNHALAQVAAAELPARESSDAFRYDVPVVQVGLYRVVGAKSEAAP
jgi:hypothetical protein